MYVVSHLDGCLTLSWPHGPLGNSSLRALNGDILQPAKHVRVGFEGWFSGAQTNVRCAEAIQEKEHNRVGGNQTRGYQIHIGSSNLVIFIYQIIDPAHHEKIGLHLTLGGSGEDHKYSRFPGKIFSQTRFKRPQERQTGVTVEIMHEQEHQIFIPVINIGRDLFSGDRFQGEAGSRNTVVSLVKSDIENCTPPSRLLRQSSQSSVVTFAFETRPSFGEVTGGLVTKGMPSISCRWILELKSVKIPWSWYGDRSIPLAIRRKDRLQLGCINAGHPD